MLNTLFDLLNYHINYTKYDLITFITNNKNRINSLFECLLEISKLNNMNFLYIDLDNNPNLINNEKLCIYCNKGKVEEIEEEISNLKNDIGFILINKYDLISANNEEYNYDHSHKSRILKKVSIETKLPIIVIKNIKDNTKKKNRGEILNMIRPLEQDSDLIIFEDNNNDLNVLKNRHGDLFELIDV